MRNRPATTGGTPCECPSATVARPTASRTDIASDRARRAQPGDDDARDGQGDDRADGDRQQDQARGRPAPARGRRAPAGCARPSWRTRRRCRRTPRRRHAPPGPDGVTACSGSGRAKRCRLRCPCSSSASGRHARCVPSDAVWCGSGAPAAVALQAGDVAAALQRVVQQAGAAGRGAQPQPLGLEVGQDLRQRLRRHERRRGRRGRRGRRRASPPAGRRCAGW